ncbi:MAG: prenyltransferase/squalene oxidase repeat-containing protein, partial [Candidatus Firestonebacteria bacterium]
MKKTKSFTAGERTGALLLVFLLLLAASRSGAAEKEYLGNAASEKAAEKALEYLAGMQAADGSFGKTAYGKNTAIVGFAGLAFMAGGHVPDKGKYGDNVSRIADYLKSSQNALGVISSSGQAMYENGFATLALCELYGMTRREDLKLAIQRSVDLIISCQNEKGGWRYQPKIADDDSSVTSCQVQALRAARDVGFIIPPETIKKALQYLKSCSNPDGGFSYTPHSGGSNTERAGACTLSLMALGDYTSPEVEKGCEYLLKTKPNTQSSHFIYGLYYCTQTMFQKGGEYWKSWYPEIRDLLVSGQNFDGSWSSKNYGTLYPTAVAALVLQLPAGYLP